MKSALFTTTHLIITLIQGWLIWGDDFYDLNIHLQSFQPIIGDDEILWLNLSYKIDLTQSIKNILWPYLLSLWGGLGGTSLFTIAMMKGLIYCLFASYFLSQARSVLTKVEYYIAFTFLLFHPYIIFLHVSLMRDDLIFSVGIIIFLWFAKFEKQRLSFKLFRNTTSVLAIVSLILLIGLRPMFAWIAVLTFLILFARQQKMLFIVCIIPFLLYVNNYVSFSLNFSISSIIFNLYKLIFSPNIFSVISGQLDVVGSGVRNIPVYVTLTSIFNLSVLSLVIICLLINYRFVMKHLLISSSVVLYCIIILLSLSLVEANVQGPRQSLLATSGLFIFFVNRFLITLSKPRNTKSAIYEGKRVT